MKLGVSMATQLKGEIKISTSAMPVTAVPVHYNGNKFLGLIDQDGEVIGMLFNDRPYKPVNPYSDSHNKPRIGELYIGYAAKQRFDGSYDVLSEPKPVSTSWEDIEDAQVTEL
ncbi:MULTISPECIES: hypothetical protein [Vibrio]|uniref:hypothetical protein n=1 Tax=Vibrio TaxID=662 RepID=UPI001054CBBC|nr:hypothetical protein [Vibrio lentus]